MNNNEQQEEWRALDEFPDYIFSNTGKAYSYKSNRLLSGSNVKGYIQLHLKTKTQELENVLLTHIIYQVFGDYPELLNEREVDHIDRDKSNNSITNLRLTTRKENLANQGKRENNTQGNQCSSEFIGVNWRKDVQKWRARIYLGKRFQLGDFKNERNAAYVYNRVASCFKPPNHWLNTLPDDFELPHQEENREYKIAEKIAQINHYLNQ